MHICNKLSNETKWRATEHECAKHIINVLASEGSKKEIDNFQEQCEIHPWEESFVSYGSPNHWMHICNKLFNEIKWRAIEHECAKHIINVLYLRKIARKKLTTSKSNVRFTHDTRAL